MMSLEDAPKPKTDYKNSLKQTVEELVMLVED
jgi:hypothetical protein